MKWVLVALLAVGGLGGTPAAIADSEPCTADVCVGPGLIPPPSAAPTPPTVTLDGPPRRPVRHGHIHRPIRLGDGPDTRPCVSLLEYRSVKAGWTQSETEARWEVASLGQRRYLPVFGYAIAYPRCGYKADLSDAGVGVRYTSGRIRAVIQYSQIGRPHGAP